MIFVVVVNFPLCFSPQVLFLSPSERDIHRTTSPTSPRNWICQKTLSLPLPLTVINMIRITFTALILKVIVNKVFLEVLLKFREGNDDRN